MQSALQLRSAQMLRAASPRAAPLARAVPSAAAPIRKAAAAALHGAGAPSLPARRTAVAPVALPGAAERRAARGGRVACEALGLGALGALCGKILKIFGISSGSAKAATTAAAGSAAAAAGSAGKAAMVAAIGMGILKYLWWAVAAALVVGLATGVLAAYLGVPQVRRGGRMDGGTEGMGSSKGAGCSWGRRRDTALLPSRKRPVRAAMGSEPGAPNLRQQPWVLAGSCVEQLAPARVCMQTRESSATSSARLPPSRSPQVATDAVSKVMGKPGMKLYTNPASRGQIVDW